MKQEHRNPKEGIRIGLDFDAAIRRALATKPIADADLKKWVRSETKETRKKRTNGRKRRPSAHR